MYPSAARTLVTVVWPSSSGCRQQADEHRQTMVSTSREADHGVDDANVQAELRRKRISACDHPRPAGRGSVADAVDDVNDRVVCADFRKLERQPETDHCIDNDVIGAETRQRERIVIRPCIVACNVMLYVRKYVSKYLNIYKAHYAVQLTQTTASLRLILQVVSGSASQVAISSSRHHTVAPSSVVGRLLFCHWPDSLELAARISP